MSLTAFAHGVVLAVGLIVALGPQNAVVFQQGATQPRLARAAPTVLTAGACDTLLIGLAVVGASALLVRVAWLRTALYAAGFAFLAYVGWTILTSSALSLDPDAGESLAAGRQVGVTASVSLLNPHAIVDTVGVVGTNALTYSAPARLAFVAGCLTVSWAWFVALAVAGRRLGRSVDARRWARRLDVVSAAVVWIVAGYMGWRLLAALDFV